ncbi:MAG: hypothetical protein JW863_00745 [Chitinispirillaceae bacterium]|nr:hypothetical protein [Chitinispirillaceae bacterium]
MLSPCLDQRRCIVAAEKAPHKSPAVADVGVFPFVGGVELRLSGYFSSDASVRLYQLNGQLVADLGDRISGGRVVFRTPHGPASLVVQVVKKRRSASRMVITAQ